MERQSFYSLLTELRCEYERVDAERRELLNDMESSKPSGHQPKVSEWHGCTHPDSRLVNDPVHTPKAMQHSIDPSVSIDDMPAFAAAVENTATASRVDVEPFVSKSMSSATEASLEPVDTQRATSKRWEVLGESTLCREARLVKLRSWFDRLNESAKKGSEPLSSHGFSSPSKPKGSEGLSLSWLQMVMDHVHGKGCVGIQRIRNVIACLESHHAEFDNDSELERGLRVEKRRTLEGLSFPIFADIVFFDSVVEDLDEQAQHDALLIHNALMTTHVEELVAHYARLPPIAAEENNTRGTSKYIDMFAAAVILINGLTIGISSDIAWEGWDEVDLAFTVFFTFEIIVKMWLSGLREHFFGSDWAWNAFDGVVVIFAVFDVALGCIAAPSNNVNGAVALVRLARLARLTRMMRLLRILRLRIFKELMLMVKGVVAGLRTLFWAIVMLLFITYACAVLLRQTVGEARHHMDDKYNTVLFGSVPWSMFVVFRCFMGDCSLPDGTPLPSHLYELYGCLFVIPYGLCIVFVVFGIFNIVTALFVECVMEAARQRRLLSNDAEKIRVGRIMTKLVMKVAQGPHDQQKPRRLMTQALGWSSPKQTTGERIIQIKGEVTREMFHRALTDPEVVRLIEDLDINVGDPSDLFDAVDADGSGQIDVGELITGIMKLLSGETKCDTVALVLASRHIRNSLQTIHTLAAEPKVLRRGSTN
jgi:hypothetical protein